MNSQHAKGFYNTWPYLLGLDGFKTQTTLEVPKTLEVSSDQEPASAGSDGGEANMFFDEPSEQEHVVDETAVFFDEEDGASDTKTEKDKEDGGDEGAQEDDGDFYFLENFILLSASNSFRVQYLFIKAFVAIWLNVSTLANK